MVNMDSVIAKILVSNKFIKSIINESESFFINEVFVNYYFFVRNLLEI
jgi:hypothetical protein